MFFYDGGDQGCRAYCAAAFFLFVWNQKNVMQNKIRIIIIEKCKKEMRKMGLQKYSLSQIADMKVWGRTTAQKDPLTLFWTGSGIELNMHASELWVEMESDYDT